MLFTTTRKQPHAGCLLFDILQIALTRHAYFRPQDARMWCAIGNCMSKLEMRSQAMVNYERAVACGDQEGIATRELARLYREAGDRHQAAECYHKHISTYGEEINAEIAEGLLYLANYHKDRKDFNNAVAYCGRLLDYNGPVSVHIEFCQFFAHSIARTGV